jgi:hypothetical protein
MKKNKARGLFYFSERQKRPYPEQTTAGFYNTRRQRPFYKPN